MILPPLKPFPLNSLFKYFHRWKFQIEKEFIAFVNTGTKQSQTITAGRLVLNHTSDVSLGYGIARLGWKNI
jgi:hypothetical protein